MFYGSATFAKPIKFNVICTKHALRQETKLNSLSFNVETVPNLIKIC